MEYRGCRASDHVELDRRESLRAGGLSLFGLGLADLLRLESQAGPPRPSSGMPARSVVFISQSGGPSQHETFDPKPEAPEGVRGEYGVTATAIPGVDFCEHLPRLAAPAHRFAVVRTMPHTAGRQSRNEHSSCMYLLHTGSTELPPGDSYASITPPRPGRFEWPSIDSLVAYAAPPKGDAGLPAVFEIPRKNHRNYPVRGPGLLGPRYERWAVDLARPFRAPDPAGSCPNCFSHDDPNDPARAPGRGPKAWWDNSGRRDPVFHLPESAADGVSLAAIGGACRAPRPARGTPAPRRPRPQGRGARPLGRAPAPGPETPPGQPARPRVPVRPLPGARAGSRTARPQGVGTGALGRPQAGRGRGPHGPGFPGAGHRSRRRVLRLRWPPGSRLPGNPDPRTARVSGS